MMKRIIFIIISTLIVPSIFGSIFDSIDSFQKFTNSKDNSIIYIINRHNINFSKTYKNKLKNEYFCLLSKNYSDTTFYITNLYYTKENKIKNYYSLGIKKSGNRYLGCKCFFNNVGKKTSIYGDTIQINQIDFWINKLNIDSLINNGCTLYDNISQEYMLSIIYFTMPLIADTIKTDTINNLMNYIDIHSSDSVVFLHFN